MISSEVKSILSDSKSCGDKPACALAAALPAKE
jgi:hypothetical protein